MEQGQCQAQLKDKLPSNHFLENKFKNHGKNQHYIRRKFLDLYSGLGDKTIINISMTKKKNVRKTKMKRTSAAEEDCQISNSDTLFKRRTKKT